MGEIQPALPPRNVRRVMLVNASEPGEVRVALLEDGELAEIFVERKSQRAITGNIYKAKVLNIEPSLQAAFVDLGQERNGFLHGSDCIPPDGGYDELLSILPETSPPVVSVSAPEPQPIPGSVPPPPPAPIPAAAGDAVAEVAKTKKRRRRGRRGGRRHSGRARAKPSSAPMLLPENAEPTPEPPAADGETSPPALEKPAAAAPPSIGPAEDSEAPGESPFPQRCERSGARRAIQQTLHRGQELLVQVAKEALGQKGPAVTTYLSLPGRYLVLMPALERLGVSKRIGSEADRLELRQLLNHLRPPAGMGVIVRTAGVGKSQTELRRDLEYLLHAWEGLVRKCRATKAPALLFEEGDVITRVFRDVFSDDVAEVLVDEPGVLERARALVREFSPGAEDRIKAYSEREPLFRKYGVEPQVQRLFHRKVPLKSGGSIVIEQTEALVAIDVNTGRARQKHDQAGAILATNLEAAREVARQVRLRDLGGLIMIDFIDMDSLDHRRRVEQELRTHLARDKARLNVLPISSLGMVEMTRQRMRHSLRRTFLETCPHCQGTGMVKSAESLTVEAIRELRSLAVEPHPLHFRLVFHPSVAVAVANLFFCAWNKLEEGRTTSVEIHGDPRVPVSQCQVWTARAGGEWTLKRASEVDDYVRNH